MPDKARISKRWWMVILYQV